MRPARFLLVVLFSVTALASDPNQQRGFAPNQVYQTGDVDHVNLFSGNVVIRLPIGQVYQVGPQLQYQFILSYNSKIWDYETEIYDIFGCGEIDGRMCGVRYGVPEKSSTAGFGWTLSLGRLLRPDAAAPPGPWTYLAPVERNTPLPRSCLRSKHLPTPST